MATAFGTQAFQQSRHARRIYVGGFPPNYGDEEALKFFLNSVIAKGLGEPNDNSYVLSIYVNQKKCFAFVELRSIELATACLDLDGIIYKKVVLKVLRANEYKPELIPPSMVGAPITLDLSSFAFGTPSTVPGGSSDKISGQGSGVGVGGSGSAEHGQSGANDDARLDSVVQFASLSYVCPGGISIVGYPFDDRAAHSFTPIHKEGTTPSGGASATNATTGGSTGAGSGGFTGLGCTQAAKKMRNMIRKYKFGILHNPEYGIDLSQVRFVDVGDVQVGKTREETKQNLTAIVGDIVSKRSVPLVIGGGSDCSYYTAQGVMSAVDARIGMVVVSAQIDDARILDDQRFSCFTVAGGGGGGGAVSHNSSCASILSDPGYQQYLQHGHAGSEMDGLPGTGPSSPQHSVVDCGGRYVRFAAQGALCTVTQANNVIQKGGHVVWLSKDIRNQSPQCTVLPANFTPDPVTSRSAPHAHTLRLFREALRCAAGIAGEQASARCDAAEVEAITAKVLEKQVSDLEPGDIGRQDSQDTITTTSPTTPAMHGPPVLRTESGTHIHETPAPGQQTAPSATAAAATAAAAGIAGSPAPVGSNEGVSSHDAPAAHVAFGPSLPPRPHGVVVSFDMGALQGSVRGCGYITGGSASTTGLTVDEILDMAMLAGADPNVLSLDISEFSPDAEDTRSNMLLCQLFYQFSMGVASRTSQSGSKHTAADTAGIEVEAKMGSFVLADHAHFVPHRIQVDKPIDLSLASSSRTPKYYHEVSSGSMDALSGGGAPQANSSAGTTAGDPTTGRPMGIVTAPPPQPYVEVDHRFSSMDVMDPQFAGPSNQGAEGYRPGSTGRQPSPSQQVQMYPSSPSSVHSNMNTAYSASSSTDSMRNIYPSSVMQGGGMMGGMNRGALQNLNAVTGVRRPSHQGTGTSPPMAPRTMVPPKMPPAPQSMGGGALYPGAAGQRGPHGLNQQQQHQQMFAQQALMLQQQQALSQRNQPYRPSAQAQPFVPQAQMQPQQPTYASQRRYEPDLHLLDPDMPASYGRASVSQASAGLYERAEPRVSFHQPPQQQPQSAALRTQAPPQQAQQQYRYPQGNPPLQQPQQQPHETASPGRGGAYMSSDFLDITGERKPGAALSPVPRADPGPLLGRKAAPTGGVDLNSAGLAGLGVSSGKGLSAAGLSSTPLDVHAFDEDLDLFDFRHQLSAGQQPVRDSSGARPPTSGQSSAVRGGNAGASGFSLYNTAGSAYSTDSLAFSNANSSLNSELMAGLGGLGSSHSLASGYGDSLFGSSLQGHGLQAAGAGANAGASTGSEQPKL